MSQVRIAARVRDADLLAGVKTVAATYRARLVHWTDTMSGAAGLHDANLVLLETPHPGAAMQEFHAAKGACPKAEIIIFAPAAATPEDVRRLFRAGAKDARNLFAFSILYLALLFATLLIEHLVGLRSLELFR